MARSYEKELQKLTSTYSWALTTENAKLVEFVDDSRDLPLVSVGSGGSRTAAIFASLIHQQTGMMSQDLTPLEMAFSTYDWKRISVILLTAQGRNSDILTAIKNAVNTEPRQLIVLCTAKSSPIGRIAREYRFIKLCELEPPFVKDGFLATNSILTFALLLLRAYRDCLNLPYELPASLGALVHPKNSKQEFLRALKKELKPLLTKDTLVVLYGKFGKPSSFDLESRFIEGSLGNVQIADYRNFAHGRHNWLAKNKKNTGVIGLITPQDERLAERILDLIPNEVPILRLSTSRHGPIAALSLVIKGMYLAGIFGDSRGVNLSKPHIPRFGRQIYHLRVPYRTIQKATNPFFGSLSQPKAVAILRKVKTFREYMTQERIDFWNKAYDRFVHNLTQARFNAVVLDYDGTLCDPIDRFVGASIDIGKELSKLLKHGIIIGIATGRGKSARRDIQRILPKSYWSRVLVGYYNGSDIGSLHDNIYPNNNIDMDSSLESLLPILEKQTYLNQIAEYECRPRQITFSPTGQASMIEVSFSLHDLVRKTNIMGIQVLESSHTIDVLAPGVSKLQLVKAVETKITGLGKPAVVLSIGDKGQWPGNDFALLSSRYSLSVDEVSMDPESCWNLAPAGYRGIQATIHYLRALEIEPGRMMFNPKKLEMAVD